MRVVQLLRRNSSELKGWLTPACQWSLTHTGIDCRKIWHQDSKNGQLGMKGQTDNLSIWHRDKKMDNWALDILAPGQYGTNEKTSKLGKLSKTT